MERKYELLLLLNHLMKAKEIEKFTKEIESKLQGTIVKKETWGLKKLAYKIQKQTEAYYLLYYVETTSENIEAYKDAIQYNKNILRSLVMRHNNKWPFEMKTTKDMVFSERKPRSSSKSSGYRRRTEYKTTTKKSTMEKEATKQVARK